MICSIIGLIIEVIALVTMVVALILGQDIFIGEIIFFIGMFFVMSGLLIKDKD